MCLCVCVCVCVCGGGGGGGGGTVLSALVSQSSCKETGSSGSRILIISF